MYQVKASVCMLLVVLEDRHDIMDSVTNPTE